MENIYAREGFIFLMILRDYLRVIITMESYDLNFGEYEITVSGRY